MATKHVYSYGAGKAEAKGKELSKDFLGGKGIGLMEMTSIGLPVPAGFTVSIPTCAEYYELGRKMPKGLDKEVIDAVKKLEKTTGKKLGDDKDPLLVSVRSGAARSMPGMLETILNLGLNDVSVEGLAKVTSNPRFAYDSYRRFIQMYSTTAMGLSKEPMEEMLHKMKHDAGVKLDTELSAEALKALCAQFKAFYKEKKGDDFPQDPMKQLWGAIAAVFGSWEAEKSVTYRRVEKITDLVGTAVNVVQMVFGNKGDNSGTGVCFTRDPNSGANEFYGDCLINAQGEDVVAGIRTPMKLIELETKLPKAYKQLCQVRKTLEAYYKEMQDLEFTIEDEKLYMLQCRTGKRLPQAAFKIAVDMVKEKLITKEQAVTRITPEQIEGVFYPIIDAKTVGPAKLKELLIGKGIDAVPGAAAGTVVFTAAEAEELAKAGKKVILVRKETSPEDVGGMHAAQGILTATGGKTSHAAVVARGWGKCCIVGAESINIDYKTKQMVVGGKVIKQGDEITLNGTTGEFFLTSLPLKKPEQSAEFFELLKWCDGIRSINVRTNADTPYDAVKAVELGAEGIGLCRTEHMFFAEERLPIVQEMILARDEKSRKVALKKLLPMQRSDFEGLFKAMNGFPVVIRTLDPPLHEFLPKREHLMVDLAKLPHADAKAKKEMSKAYGIPVGELKKKLPELLERVEELHEFNPMLGHRGCRLGITYPEITEMQVRAIFEAAAKVAKKGIKVVPEVMIPLIGSVKELEHQKAIATRIAKEVFEKAGVPDQHYMIGTMIEIPRAALTADEVAKEAEFFSFGTNDLTQTTMGLSRDDYTKFSKHYEDLKIFAADPFGVLDQTGVGKLIDMAVKLGRKTRPDLEVGICGEHGGEPSSVEFCVKVGMNYVSCSPYRVPIARLAAAQAVIASKGGNSAESNRTK